ncbi:hypothetical protein [Mesorhizobium sp. M4B.F.Ca.ET.017.02.2.1]|uniref:hypothetical protein n=1 Tax=Mesorhizobium sp. M4B.F.Ca.ET.017.02.2.1 TaxID=2496649 RepID=UPI0016760CA4|nr:hypothetical protein [Mesorhizobium sp. M4B.F.Ca.ET.017.02.2.1]
MTDIIFRKTVAEAKAKGEEIEVLARILAEKMEAIHGEEFQVMLNHEARFVLIAVK